MIMANNMKLQWSDQGSKLINYARDLWGQSELTDVTLTCKGGHNFNAHRLVLAGASHYFRILFQDLPVYKHPVIFLKDIEANDMEYILQFLYHGEVIVPAEKLNSLTKVAEDFGITGLVGTGCSDDEHFKPLKASKSNKRSIRDSQKCSKSSEETSKKIKLKIKKEDMESDEDLSSQVFEDELTAYGDNWDDDDEMSDDEEESGVKIKETGPPEVFEASNDYLYNDPELLQDLVAKATAEKKPKKEKKVFRILGQLNPMLFLNDFIYSSSKKWYPGDKHRFWQCRMKKCKATLRTDANYQNPDFKTSHMHDAEPEKIEVIKQVEKIRILARNATLANPGIFISPRNFVDQLLGDIPEWIQPHMPTREKLIRRARISMEQTKAEMSGQVAPVEEEQQDDI